MKIKLIKIKACKTCKEVLLYLDVDADGDYCVRVIAWHTINDGDYIQEEVISAESIDALERIIADYSEFSANQFANSFQV